MQQSRYLPPLVWLVLTVVVAAVLPGTCLAKKKVVGERFEYELPCPTSPPWVADKVSWPATLVVVRAELGKTADGLQTVKIVPRVANAGWKDLKATVDLTLLDADGGVIHETWKTESVEEREVGAFVFRVKLPPEQAAAVATCRLALAAERD